MELNNAPDCGGADPALDAARRYSRYVRMVLEAEPQMALDSGCGQPFSAGEMESFLAAHPASDEAAMQRALRMLRKRVMLRLIARDIGGLADLAEVIITATALAETTLCSALSHLSRWHAES
ncbi:MAG: hypothetical protein Q8N17_22590, partial [Burkholderiaceae bacterium]|nr:hypothetical protein [Burkholderiaceae bacterium]